MDRAPSPCAARAGWPWTARSPCSTRHWNTSCAAVHFPCVCPPAEMIELLEPLRAIVGEKRVLARAGELRTLRVRRPAGLPEASRARRLSRHARRSRSPSCACSPSAACPSCARGAGTGLSGGALADDVVLLGLHRLKRILSIDAENARAVVEPGVVNVVARPRRGGVRSALRARSVQPDGVHHRRQRRRECGRSALPQVRRHAQPRARHHRAAAERRDRAARQSRWRGRRLRPARRLRRLRGLLRRRARRHRAADEGSAGGAHAARRLLVRRCGGACGVGDHRGGHRAGGDGDDGRRHGAGGGSVDLRGRLSDRCGGDPAHRARWRRGGARRRCRARRRACAATPARAVCARATDPAERARLWQGRKKAFGAMGRISPHLVVQDAVVPRTKLPEMLAEIHRIADAARRARLQRLPRRRRQPAPQHRLRPARPSTSRQRVHDAMSEIMQACIAAGGTITGEHGVGLDKLPYMDALFSRRHAGRDVRPARGVRSRSPRESGQGRAGARLPRMARRAFRAGARVTSERAAASDHAAARRWTSAARARRARRRCASWARARGSTPAARCAPSGTLELRSLVTTGMVDYEPGDLTLTARADDDARRDRPTASRAEGQWLPLDPVGRREPAPSARRSPRRRPARWRRAFGTPREQVLGVEVVTGTGEVIRAGGRVVKNVAGFDLTRLMTGAWGTLGAITEVSRAAARAARGRIARSRSSAERRRRMALDQRERVHAPTPPSCSRRAGARARPGRRADAAAPDRRQRGARARGARAVAALGEARHVDDSGRGQRLVDARAGGRQRCSGSARGRHASPPLWERVTTMLERVGGEAHATLRRGVMRCIIPLDAADDEQFARLRGIIGTLRVDAQPRRASACRRRCGRRSCPLAAADHLSRGIRAAFDPDHHHESRHLSESSREPSAFSVSRRVRHSRHAARRRARGHRCVRALRLLPPGLPHVPDARGRERQPARAHRAHAVHRGRHARRWTTPTCARTSTSASAAAPARRRVPPACRTATCWKPRAPRSPTCKPNPADRAADPVRVRAARADAAGDVRRTRSRARSRLSWLLSRLPGRLGFAMAMLDSTRSPLKRRTYDASGDGSRGTAALLTGCVMEGLYAETNRATERTLTVNGYRMVTALGQRCCGALHAHAGDDDTARKLARANVAAFEKSGADYVVANAAGCGAMMKEYGQLLADDPAVARARRGGGRARARRERAARRRGPRARRRAAASTVTYDAPCHLLHAQRVAAPPLAVLARGARARAACRSRGVSTAAAAPGIYNLIEPRRQRPGARAQARQHRGHIARRSWRRAIPVA